METSTKVLVAGLALATWWGVFVEIGGAQDGAAPFSSDERARLVRGELVRRGPGSRPGERLYGGTSWMRVSAPVDEVWAMMSDPASYPGLVPSLDRVRVIEEEGDTRVVWMHHAYAIAETEYYTRMTFDHEHHRLHFALDRSRPHDTLRSGHGFLQLTPYRGDTIVAWGMLADPGGGMIAQVFGPFLNELLLLPPQCVHDRVAQIPNERCGS